MQYFLEREGQSFGPYSDEQLRQYVAEGRLSPNDLLRPVNGNQSFPWQSVLAPAQPVLAPSQAVYQPQPQFHVTPVAGPMPPEMEWWQVALISVFCGLFGIYWAFKELNFVKRIDPRNNSKQLVILAFGLIIGAYALVFLSAILAAATRGLGFVLVALMPLMFIGAFVALIVAMFQMRASIHNYYNTVEPMGINLMDTTGTILTLFFPIYFFQFHFSQIAAIKKARGER